MGNSCRLEKIVCGYLLEIEVVLIRSVTNAL